MLENVIKFFDSRTWFMMLISLIVIVAYFIFLGTGNPNTDNVQVFFNLIMGYWFGTASTAIGASRAVAAVAAYTVAQGTRGHNTQINQ